ncbi:MAG: hypothetical protein U9N86_10285, partial [Bacteroidota bacterium]|nr:hypothetical protein [Bacteroidota bacterium]
VWLHVNGSCDGFLVRAFNWTQGKANATAVQEGYWDWLFDDGTIYNSTGGIKNIQGAEDVTVTGNHTAFTITMVAKELGTIFFNLSDVEAYNGGPEISITTSNNSALIVANTTRTNQTLQQGSFSFSSAGSNQTLQSGSFSFTAASASAFNITDPYPSNQTVNLTRPPTNLSAYIDGTNITTYFFFYNMTPTVDIWVEIVNWTNISNQRCTVIDIYNGATGSNFTLREFIWGNKTYNWSVNATDGNIWINKTYTYSTEQTVDGANARLDVNNDDTVDVFDALQSWNNRDGQSTYNGIYDVSVDIQGDSPLIDVFDALLIWNRRS